MIKVMEFSEKKKENLMGTVTMILIITGGSIIFLKIWQPFSQILDNLVELQLHT